MALPEGKSFTINGSTFRFSIATGIMELIRGLSGVASLEPFDGMLFDFGYEMAVTMTPQGLRFPIDVAFISEEGEVKGIARLDPLYGYIQSSSVHVRYALEVPVGFFEQHNVSVGDTIL